MAQIKKTDVVVIGAGPAGYVCAIRLAQLGKKVTVVDRGELGGVCLNVGCIPSKALIHAATVYDRIQHAKEMGIEISGAKVNFKRLMAWKGEVVQKLTGGVGSLLKANGCEVIKGEARFTGPRALSVGSTELQFDQCVIATGSRPSELLGFAIDQKDVWDSTGALAQEKQPESLLCIGGGYIGLELGTFYAKLGTQVTVIEAFPNLLGSVDPDLTQVVEKGLKVRKVEVLLKTKAKGFKKEKGGLEVTLETADGKSVRKNFEKILVTVGRRPNTDSLDLEKAGLRADEKGFLEVDPRRQTRVAGIYAIGDVAGQPLLAHKGSKEGIVAAEAIAGKSTIYDVVAIPAVIFTDPEIASVGLTDKEARERGHDTQVGVFPFAANGRALSVRESEGFVKMIGDRATGRLLGVHIVGPEASNLIAEATLALEMGARVEDLALTVHAHPTLPESLMEAAEATLGHAIHIFQRKAAPQRRPEANA